MWFKVIEFVVIFYNVVDCKRLKPQFMMLYDVLHYQTFQMFKDQSIYTY